SKGKDRVKGVGMGLYLVTDQELEPLAQRVREAGISFESPLAPLPWGPMGFSVRDPDGFRVTVANPE
ncbi:MAG TPA: VOC family protein, partial [Gemmatimonadales bacterium]|nr:VOC family protein [Gemmatimonadales bacterium]